MPTTARAKRAKKGPITLLPPELRPNIDHLVTEDDTPVDNLYSEKQQRLLTRPLYSSWKPSGGRSFLAMANVGMFFSVDEPPLVPDTLLSVGVKPRGDLRKKTERSYFFWEIGKPPDGVIEIVSNKEGEELGFKKFKYAELGIPYYIVWDPYEFLGTPQLHFFGLHSGVYKVQKSMWMPTIELGLKLWSGKFEDCEATWLRWCDQNGEPIPTGEERAEIERQRAETERQRAEKAEQRAKRLADKLRQLGVEPPNGAKEPSTK